MSFAYKISAWNRERKWQIFLNTIQFTPESKILDVGFSDEEYVETDNYLEKHYSFPENITALTLDIPDQYLSTRGDDDFQVPEEAILRKRQASVERYPQVKIVGYDGRDFPFSEQSFDICWSNAVLEHVGDAEKQIYFLKEVKRVAKLAFITTPNRFFPIEVHTLTPLLHFLPKNIFDMYLRASGKEWASGEYMYLLSLWALQSRLRSAGITNYKIIKNRVMGFVLDFIVIFQNS